MDTLRETKQIKGLHIVSYKQSETQILCKIRLTPSDAQELCKRTKSGLFLNKEFHDRFINMIVTELDKTIKEGAHTNQGKNETKF